MMYFPLHLLLLSKKSSLLMKWTPGKSGGFETSQLMAKMVKCPLIEQSVCCQSSVEATHCLALGKACVFWEKTTQKPLDVACVIIHGSWLSSSPASAQGASRWALSDLIVVGQGVTAPSRPSASAAGSVPVPVSRKQCVAAPRLCNLQDWLQPRGRGLGSMKHSGSLAAVTSGQPRGSAPELAAPGSHGVHLQLRGGVCWR